MKHSVAYKSLLTFSQLLLRPRLALRCVWDGIQERDAASTDRILAQHMHWCKGKLPRKPLVEMLPAAAQIDISLPRVLDRIHGTLITIEEAGCLCAIVQSIKPRKLLEIGTFDGGTALALAANAGPESQVVTVDLPLDFTPEKMTSLPNIEKGSINLTERSQVGRQFKDHALSQRIKQVYGDSATMDWEALGGPFDFVFIDGCHSEAYVISDTRNALAHTRKPGVIVWHDYGMIETVSVALDRLTREISNLSVGVILGTRLALGFFS